MKKNLFFLVFILTACSSSSDSNTNIVNNYIYGDWEVLSIEGDTQLPYYFSEYSFYANRSGRSNVFSEDVFKVHGKPVISENETDRLYGQFYLKNENTLFLKYD